MPKKAAARKAQQRKRAGAKPSTQAGEFVREEMHELKRGKGNAQSRKQAVAIGLSRARRSGVELQPPAAGKASPATRKKAKQDLAQGRAGAKKKSTAAARKSARKRGPAGTAARKKTARKSRS